MREREGGEGEGEWGVGRDGRHPGLQDVARWWRGRVGMD